MQSSLRQFVRLRAENRCEYCHLPQELFPSFHFHIEHVRAKQHHGGDEADNLAYSCQQCNLFKGPNQSAYDPQSQTLVPLFNPRVEVWHDHFEFSGPCIIGLTPMGRATIDLLQMNSDQYIELRELQDELDW